MSHEVPGSADGSPTPEEPEEPEKSASNLKTVENGSPTPEEPKKSTSNLKAVENGRPEEPKKTISNLKAVRNGSPTPEEPEKSASNLKAGSENDVQDPTQQPEDDTSKQKGKQKRHSVKGQTSDSKDVKGKRNSLKGQMPAVKDGEGKQHSHKGASPHVKDVPTTITTTTQSSNIYEDMDEATLSTFRDLFNMLDQTNTGIITANSMYKELHCVDSEITFEEVENVIKKVNKDGNGNIDFDEFLYHMTHIGNDPDEIANDETKKKKYHKRKRMFYKAIAHFTIQQTLEEIEKTIRVHAPHVLHHYVEGARLLGLTFRQLKREMKKLLKSKYTKNDSPYAHPLNFVHIGEKSLVQKKKIIAAPETLSSFRSLQLEEEEVAETPPAVVANLNSIHDTMMLVKETVQTVEGIKLPDANLIKQLREKIGSVKEQLNQSLEANKQESDPTTSALPSVVPPQYSSAPVITVETTPSPDSHRSTSTIPSFLGQKPIPKKKSHMAKLVPSSFNVEEAKAIRRKQRLATGWKAPRIQYDKGPLPVLRVNLKKTLNYDNLTKIRKKVEKTKNDYYRSLRQEEIKVATEQWDRIYAHVHLPKRQKEVFREIYNTYTATREEESFVVCPWEPGPLSYFRQSKSQACSPKYFEGGRKIKTSLDHLIVKPLVNAQFGSTSPSPRSSPNLCCCVGKKPFCM